MNIFSCIECIDQHLILREVCKNTKLDLRIICTDQCILASGSCKGLPQLSAQLLTNRYVLQVRFRTGKSTCCCNILLEMGTNLSIRTDQRFHSFHIRGIQLGIIAVHQYCINDWVQRSDLFQHIRTGTVTPFGFLSRRQLQCFEQNFAKLNR